MAKRTPTAEQKQRAEQRRAKFRELAKHIKAMDDGQRMELAASMYSLYTVEGRQLSEYNRCLIAMQNPAATLVGGFRQWLKQGRAVRKGESGLMIWIPSVRKGEKSDDSDRRAEPDDLRFVMGTVFDVSQTEEIEQPAEVAA